MLTTGAICTFVLLYCLSQANLGREGEIIGAVVVAAILMYVATQL